MDLSRLAKVPIQLPNPYFPSFWLDKSICVTVFTFRLILCGVLSVLIALT